MNDRDYDAELWPHVYKACDTIHQREGKTVISQDEMIEQLYENLRADDPDLLMAVMAAKVLDDLDRWEQELDR